MTIDSIKITEDKSINIKNCEMNNQEFHESGLEQINMGILQIEYGGSVEEKTTKENNWFIHSSTHNNHDFIIKIMSNKKVFIKFKTIEMIKSFIFVTSDKNKIDFYNKCIKASFINSSKGNDESTRLLIGEYDNYSVYFYKDIHNVNNVYQYCITMIFKGGHYTTEIELIEVCNKTLNDTDLFFEF